MNSNTIEQTLIQIEKNLEKLESARNQVLEVTGHGKEITTIMVNLINNIQEVYDIINHESDSFVQGLADNQENFDQKINGMAGEYQKSISGFLNQFEKLSAKVSINVNKSIEETSSKTKILHEKQELSYNRSISNLNNLNEAVDSFRKKLFETNFQELVDPITRTIEDNGKSLIEIVGQNTKDISDLANKILVRNKENSDRVIEGLNKRINILEKNQKMTAYITWGLIAVVLISLFVLK